MVRWITIISEEDLIILILKGYEEKTFEILWEMSASGSDSEECFLRMPQTQFYFDERPKEEPLAKMPNVSKYSVSHASNGGSCCLTNSSDISIQTNWFQTPHAAWPLRPSPSTHRYTSTIFLPHSAMKEGVSFVDQSRTSTRYWKGEDPYSLVAISRTPSQML